MTLIEKRIELENTFSSRTDWNTWNTRDNDWTCYKKKDNFESVTLSVKDIQRCQEH